MQIDHLVESRKRNGNCATCANCSEPLHPKRGSRRQRFCSYRCRDEARRNRNFQFFATTRSAIPRSVQNNRVGSVAWRGDFGDRPLPLNLVGGHRWPDGIPVERELLTNIIRAEIGGACILPPQDSES
jgi:hypothetical protein